MPLAPAPRPPDASVVHASWSIDSGVFQMLAAPDARDQVARLIASLRKNDSAEVIHEGDHKAGHPENPKYRNPFTGKGATVAEIVAAKNTFYDLVKAVRPDLNVVNTLTAGLFYPGWGGNPETWGAVKADILGVDFDGVVPSSTNYLDWKPAYPAINAFAAKHYSGRKCAPEVGVIRYSSDTTGTARAAFLARQLNELSDQSYEYACGYVYGTPGSTDDFADTASDKAWRAAVVV